jgi:hypothetical protein
VAYEYEHEFWLRVDGSGTVHVTGRPTLWTAFKALPQHDAPEATAKEAARRLFESSGLRVRRVTLTRRDGRPYLFVSADFADVNRLPGTPAFPDLQIRLEQQQERLHLEGSWLRPASAAKAAAQDREGLMAVRFHLPSKVYSHRNAFAGVERGNIVGWRQDTASGLDGRPLEFGAEMDQRSILHSTVGLFAAAIALALAILAAALLLAFRKGRGARAGQRFASGARFARTEQAGRSGESQQPPAP